MIERFIGEKIAQPSQIYKSNDNSKNKKVVENSDIIYLCVRPQNLAEVYIGLKDNLENKVLVTAVAAVESDSYYQNLGNIELIRIIPSITNKVGGTILFSAGKFVKHENKKRIHSDLSKIANVYEVPEEHINKYTHLASCSPAIISAVVKEYLSSIDGIDEEKGKEIILDALYNTAVLLKQYGFEIINQVCTKNGISRVGVNFVSKNFPMQELSNNLLTRMKNVKEKYGG